MNRLNYSIRPVQVKDLEQLFPMLVQLVRHEGNHERFKLTPARLETELFGKEADWNCLVAVKEEQLLGFCFYTYGNINRAFNTSPMIEVDHLYVSPEHRSIGISRNLFYQLALIARSQNIGRLNVWCIKDNALGQNFYNKIGGVKIDSIDVFSIQISELLEQNLLDCCS